jgi:glutathione S-transferase
MQHLELNAEWVARRLYKESFFGGCVSAETKREANDRLVIGLEAVAQLSQFNPYIFGPAFTAADCAAYVHFVMIKQTTVKIYGENMLERFLPNSTAYTQLMDSRPHIQTMMADRDAAVATFLQIDVNYEG